MTDGFSVTQKRALAVVTLIALAFGAYFLRHYLLLMAVAAVLAYLFAPLYRRLRTRMNVGLSATVTLLAAAATVAVPLAGVIFLAVLQISQMVTSIGHWVEQTDFTALAQRLLDSANGILARVPFLDITLTPDSVRQAATKVGQARDRWRWTSPATRWAASLPR